MFHAMGFNIVPSSVPIAEAGKHPELNRPGEGHVHLMLDLQPLVVWFKTDPYTFHGVPPGEHQLMVELVNNDHASLSPPVIQLVRFRSAGSQAQAGLPMAPQLSVESPRNGASLSATDFDVSFKAVGINIVPSSVPIAEAGKHPEANRVGEGHVHLMLDLQPLVVWYKRDPYHFANLPPGDHQLMVELVNNDHSSLSPPVVQIIRFRIELAMPTTGMPSLHKADQQPLPLLMGALSMLVGALVWHRQRQSTH
jgi:hypothetical protein